VKADFWLAKSFGCPVYSFAADEEPHFRGGSPAFLQVKIPVDDIATLARYSDSGWRVVDVAVTMLRGVSGARRSQNSNVRFAVPGDFEMVTRIAAKEIIMSRFHLDPKIASDIAVDIKRRWASAYFEGTRGNQMLVIEHAGVVAGFLGSIATRTGDVIDLIAVSREHHGKGLGTALVDELLAAANLRVRVGTQLSNVGAVRFYESQGFKLESSSIAMHRHV
jgi:dTDP-4-amino-4,6-dideoxy-D-galactose acyltransferase